MSEKRGPGRPAKNERNAAIVAQREAGVPLREIGRRFGVSGQSVMNIIRRDAPHLVNSGPIYRFAFWLGQGAR
jgi:DNA invertase Pin-like site-specific DNA recombinase